LSGVLAAALASVFEASAGDCAATNAGAHKTTANAIPKAVDEIPGRVLICTSSANLSTC
jgi:hypothetical protein